MNDVETAIYNNDRIDLECPICLLEIKLEKEMPCCNNSVCEDCYNDWHITNQNSTCVFCRFDTNIQNNSNRNQNNILTVLIRRLNNKWCITCLLTSFSLFVSCIYIIKLCCIFVY